MTEIPYSPEHPLLGIGVLALNALAKLCVLVLVACALISLLCIFTKYRRQAIKFAMEFGFIALMMYGLGGWVPLVIIAFLIIMGVKYAMQGMGGEGIPDSPAYHQGWGGPPF